MPDSTRRRPRHLLRTLAEAPAWKLGTGAMALLGGAFFIGVLFQSGREADRERTKTGAVDIIENERNAKAQKDRAFADLTIENTELLRRLRSLDAQLSASRAEKDRLVAQGDFLRGYTADLKSPSEAGNQRLVDTICSLWKDGRQWIRIERQPLLLSVTDIKEGRLTPALQLLLVQNFVPLEPLMKIRLGDAASGSATPISASGRPAQHPSASATMGSANPQIPASIEKQLQDIRVAKFIVFPDGSRFELPQAVAVAVQIRRECGLF